MYCLAICDTNISPFTYTGSENIGITDNQLSLDPPIQINDEIVLHPRKYDGAMSYTLPGTTSIAFR